MKSDQVALPFNMFDVVISGRIRRRIWRICWKDTWPKREMAEGMGKSMCEGTRFFGGDNWGTSGAELCFLIPGVSLESPSIAPRGCCFLTGKRLGEQIFDIGSLWQPLGGYISSGKPSRLLWTSFYGQHLRGWFSSWNASQFLVLPYKLMSTKPVAVCRCFGGWKGEKCRNFHNRGKRVYKLFIYIYIYTIYKHCECIYIDI